jgi:hypothetical protein
MKSLFVTLSLISVFLLASTSPVKKKLIGVWKIQSMEIKGIVMRHEEMGLPYIEFNDEGGFMIKVSASAEKGRYSLKGNDITLKFLIPKRTSQMMSITKLDERELDYTTSDSSGLVKVKCYRITEGLNGDSDKDKDKDKDKKKH